MPEGNSDLSSMLSKVLSDPEAMKRIGALAENFRSGTPSDAAPASEAEQNGEHNSGEERQGGGERVSSSVPALPHGLNKKDNDQRMALLSALKPYLGGERREKVDMMLRMLRLLSLADLGALLK